MYQPINGNYDVQMEQDMRRTTNAVVGWLLMASWCYYIEPVPCSLLSDERYDKACKWLLKHYDSITHKYKDLLPREALEAGSAFHLSAGQYPHGIVTMARIAKRVLEESV